MINKFYLLLLLISLFCNPAYGQWNNLKFQHLSTKNGLSQNTIQCIYEDDLGFLWFGTRDGLNKYDGYKFSVYRKDPYNKKSFLSNNIIAITQDKEKRMWIATSESKSLNVLNMVDQQILDGEIFNPQKLDLSNIVTLSTLKTGDILIGSRSSGLLKYGHASKKIDSTQIADEIIAAVEDNDRRYWLGTVNGGMVLTAKDGKVLRRFSTKQNGKNKIQSDHISTVFKDETGTIWVGTNGAGLLRFNKASSQFEKITYTSSFGQSGTNFILSLAEDVNGNIWIGTENEGLFIYNPNTKRSRSYRHIENDQHSIGSNSIKSIKRDRKGNMWIGTSTAGISVVSIDAIRFQHFRHEKNSKSLSNSIVNAIFEDSKKRIWIGTDGGGLNQFVANKGDFIHYQNLSLSPSQYIVAIAEDDSQNLWLGTWGDGVKLFNPDSKKYREIKSDSGAGEISSNYIITIIQDSKKRMWVGTYGGGLNLYRSKPDSVKIFKARPNHKSISSNYILSLFEDSKGRIWVGTEGGGLNLFNEENESFEVINSRSAFRNKNSTFFNDNVKSIAEDHEGYLWLGTASGLHRFDPDEFTIKTFFRNNGLPNDVINAVVVDKLGILWASTNKGVFKLDPQSEDITVYSVADGLQDDEFRQANCLDSDGRIYFGGREGFNVFNPSDIEPVKYDPAIVFTNFQIFNKDVSVSQPHESGFRLNQSINYTDKIELSYDQNFISFEFASLNFTATEKKQYQYKLDGYDTEWQSLGTKNHLSFTDLSPGNYHLYVRGYDNTGKWSNNLAHLEITIIPPFWATWWFRLLFAIATIASVALFFFQRLKNIRKRNRLLEERISMKTVQLSKANEILKETNDKIQLQNLHLEDKNSKISNYNDKILEQQKQIIGQNRLLEEIVSELEVSNKMKDKFFSILGHDLKNPLSAISGLTDLLKENIDQMSHSEVVPFLNDISASTNSINNLLINLLDWGKSQSKTFLFQPRKFNIYELVMKNIYLFKIQLRNKNISYIVDIGPGQEMVADYQMINTIIRNILSNSVKFTEASGTIYFSFRGDDDSISLTIKDTGVGLDKEQIKSIEKNQVEPKLGTEGETGTGLGLQICKEFISYHSGKLNIKSTLGEGTEFEIALPRLIVEADQKIQSFDKIAAEKKERTIADYQHNQFAGKKILVIDDNREIRNLLQRSLESIFEVHQAENGKIGLAIAKELQPDLIITDLIMPEMDGLEFCKQIKSDINCSHIPVLLLTGEVHQESQILGYKAGADAYLSKPFNRNLLLSVIHNFLLRQQKNQEKIVDQLEEFDSESLNALDREFLEKIQDLIKDNLQDPELNHKKICDYIGISRSVLYAKLSALTGKGVHDFIKNVRLQEAVKLMKDGKLNITQVSYEVGFSTPSYFSKSFSKKYKKSPKDYLRNSEKTSI